MTENKVIRLCDYERRSKSADACEPRDPADADVIVLPVIRIERQLKEFNRAWHALWGIVS